MEIARELQVSKTVVGEDMQYLREQAKQTIKEYATDHLPAQYQVCLSALDSILKHAHEILQDARDNREKMQALQLFKETRITKLELLSNATTIDSALNYIRSKQQQTQYKKKLVSELACDDNDKDDKPSHKHTVF